MRPQARKYHNNISDVPLEMTSMVPLPVMGLKFADSLDQYEIPNNQRDSKQSAKGGRYTVLCVCAVL